MAGQLPLWGVPLPELPPAPPAPAAEEGDIPFPVYYPPRRGPRPERPCPKPWGDPCGHLEAHQGRAYIPPELVEERAASCPDCAQLVEEGFRQCARCGVWAHGGCMYQHDTRESRTSMPGGPVGLWCAGCHLETGHQVDGRAERVQWPPRCREAWARRRP